MMALHKVLKEVCGWLFVNKVGMMDEVKHNITYAYVAPSLTLFTCHSSTLLLASIANKCTIVQCGYFNTKTGRLITSTRYTVLYR